MTHIYEWMRKKNGGGGTGFEVRSGLSQHVGVHNTRTS